MNRHGRQTFGSRTSARRGTILVVTMWIVLILVGLLLTLAQATRVEAICSANGYSCLQAQAVEQGAVQYVLAELTGLKGKVPADGDIQCEGVRVGQGAFWILRNNDSSDDRTWRFGLADECAKVNLNTARLTMLQKLPGMTDELSACLVDWRSSGTTPSAGGAKDEYYLLLSDPYLCKKGPLETLDELFLVKGATREIVYGEDINRNGLLDANEDDAELSEPFDDRNGKVERGIGPFVTVCSVSPNTDTAGQRRINVNDRRFAIINRRRVTLPSQALTNLLNQKLGEARRQAVHTKLVQIFASNSMSTFRNVLDFYQKVGLTPEEFKLVADRLTTNTETSRNGLINVNTAPKEVLACLPGLDETDAVSLVAKRATLSSDDLNSIAWVVEVLTPAKAAGIGLLITTQSSRFSADIVSVSSDGRSFRRCRIVVDAQPNPPRVIYRQELTQLGWPLSPEILSQLRSGVSMDQIAPGQTFRQEIKS
jgi:type II secretory pathway component PulK